MLRMKGFNKLMIMTFFIAIFLSAEAVQAKQVKDALNLTAYVKGVNSLKWGLVSLIPGCQVAGTISLIEGGIGVALSTAAFFAKDPPVEDIPIIKDVMLSGWGSSPTGLKSFSQGTVIDIIGENFEFKASDNRVQMNDIEIMISPVSTQERLTVGIPLSVQGQVQIVISNSIGESAPFSISVTSISTSSGSGEITYAFAQKNKQLLSVLDGYVQANPQPFNDAGVSIGQLQYNITLEMNYIDSFVSEVLPTLSESELQQADGIVSEPPDVFSLMDQAIAAMSGPVGGVVVSVDKLGLLAPYIALTSTILSAIVATTIYVKCVKHRKEKQ